MGDDANRMWEDLGIFMSRCSSAGVNSEIIDTWGRVCLGDCGGQQRCFCKVSVDLQHPQGQIYLLACVLVVFFLFNTPKKVAGRVTSMPATLWERR